ncbi:MAG: ABC transporter permease [Mariprofundaceae bacterium]
MPPPLTDTLLHLLAAWLLLAGASLWAARERLGLARPMLAASLRALLQLLALAFVLQWVFAIEGWPLQAVIITGFCLIAARTSAGHAGAMRGAWAAASTGLMAGCALTLPWLAFSGAISADSRALIPLGSMVAANGMNAVSLMYHRIRSGAEAGEGIRAAMIPPVDTLRMAGLVHMPGIFVGMVLAGSPPLAAASAQLVVLYMVVTSSFTACVVSWLILNHWNKREADTCG